MKRLIKKSATRITFLSDG